MAILELGNDILGSLGVEEIIQDVGVFFSDAFYIQFFQAAFPHIDFTQVQPGRNEQEMAENLQDLIDLLGQQILKVDLAQISGPEIIMGNPEHCIHLLQLLQEITVMMDEEGADEEGGDEDGSSSQKQTLDVEQKMVQQQQIMMGQDEMADLDDDEDEYGDEYDEREEELKKELELIQKNQELKKKDENINKSQSKNSNNSSIVESKKKEELEKENSDIEEDYDNYNEDFEEEQLDEDEDEEEDEKIKPLIFQNEKKQVPELKPIVNKIQEVKPQPKSQTPIQDSSDESDDESATKIQSQPDQSVKTIATAKKSDDDFKDYDDEMDDYDEEFEDEEEVEDQPVKNKIVFPTAFSQPVATAPVAKKPYEKKDPLSQFVTIKKEEQKKEVVEEVKKEIIIVEEKIESIKDDSIDESIEEQIEEIDLEDVKIEPKPVEVKEVVKIIEQPKRQIMSFPSTQQQNMKKQVQQQVQDPYSYGIDLTQPKKEIKKDIQAQVVPPVQYTHQVEVKLNEPKLQIQQVQPLKELQFQQKVITTEIKCDTSQKQKNQIILNKSDQQINKDINEISQDEIYNKQKQDLENEKHQQELKAFENHILKNLDKLDLEDRHQLLEYMQDEFDRDPSRFPFPKELLEEYIIKQMQIQKQQKTIQDKKFKKQNSTQVSNGSPQKNTDNDQLKQCKSTRKKLSLSRKKSVKPQEEIEDQRTSEMKSKFNQRSLSSVKMSQFKNKKISRPQSAIVKSKINVKMPFESQQNYEETYQSRVSQQRRPSSSKRPLYKKKQQQKNLSSQKQQQILIMSPKDHQKPKSLKKVVNKTPYKSTSKQNINIPLVDNNQLSQLSKEELQDLFKKQQSYILTQQQKPTTQIYGKSIRPYSAMKPKPQKKIIKKLIKPAVTLQSYTDAPFNIQRPLTASTSNNQNTGPQSQTMINNFFLNFSDLANNPQLIANQLNNVQSSQLSQNYSQQQESSLSQNQASTNHLNGQYFKISDEDLVQLLQSGQILAFDKKQELKSFLESKILENHSKERNNFYTQIYDILMNSVNRTHSKISESVNSRPRIDKDDNEDDQKILRQKNELDSLFKQYQFQDRKKEALEKAEDDKKEKKRLRDIKIQQIQEKKFKDELMNKQKSMIYKRENHQTMMTDKIYSLASQIEKTKLITEKKEFREQLMAKKQQGKSLLDAIDNFYGHKVNMLKESIKNEKFERQIASSAQKEILDKMKRDNLAFKKMVGIPLAQNKQPIKQ